MSRNELLDILAGWNHATTRQTLNVALRYLGSRGLVAEGSKGLIWVPEAKGAILDAILRGRRL